MSDESIRVLIINYFYPPVIDAHAYRWEQIARHWVAQGHQVDVISGRLHGVTDRTFQDGVNVARVGFVARPIMHSSAPQHRAMSLHTRLKSSVVNAFRPLYRKLYWPDAWWHWWPYAVREVLRRRHLGYDLVVSYSPCLGAHLAAAVLKRWSKSAEMTWIADYGDPFSISSTMPPNNLALYGRLNQLVERRIARQADMLVFTNESTAAAYHEAGVCPQDKLRVVPHLVDVQRLYAGGRGEKRSDYHNASAAHTTHLLYIGGFHRGIREPDLLFDIMRRLNRNAMHEYVLTIYGPANGFDLSPADCPQIRYKGMIAREKAMELIREADVLVNVDNMNCVMSPSKIVEYIGTGRPLLNLKSGGVDHPALARYVQCKFALELSREDLPSNDAGLVAQFLSRTAGTVASLQTVESVLEGYTLPRVAEQYLALALETRQQTVGE
jgi:glycosyltransferase involved in cell wall biosynthesis